MWAAIRFTSSGVLFRRRWAVRQIDQRRVDVLCNHDQELPTKEKCLSVCLCVTSHSYLGTYVLTPYVCSETLSRH